MKITLTIGELSQKVNDWNYACRIIGLNPWCLNEGLASSDTEISITIEQLHQIGLQWMLTEDKSDTQQVYNEPDESMDGDFDSGMASAGLGTDEDYEHNLIDNSSFED